MSRAHVNTAWKRGPTCTRRRTPDDLIRAMHPKSLALGTAELASLDTTVREYLPNPDVVAMPNLLCLAWGRKPSPR
jgi:hypothetical protein